MSVEIETYIITGIKLNEEQTEIIFKNEYLEDISTYNKKNGIRALIDGMNGQYTWVGLIEKIDLDSEEIDLNMFYKPDSFKGYMMSEIRDVLPEEFKDLNFELKTVLFNHYV